MYALVAHPTLQLEITACRCHRQFGGVLHIPFYDGTGSSYGDWELKLKIK
jgi:hypothetical protein